MSSSSSSLRYKHRPLSKIASHCTMWMLSTVYKSVLLVLSLAAVLTTARHIAKHENTQPNSAKTEQYFAPLKFLPRKNASKELEQPEVCSLWRSIARKPSQLRLYRRHFNSHDFADWFLYVSVFGEKWHASRSVRPKYIDIASNHARRWSTTWFFDRCLGWDGVCAEPNPLYWDELSAERHCKVVRTCLSDKERKVNFSFTGAFGGVVRDDAVGGGVDGHRHEFDKKYERIFNGIKEITCRRVQDVLEEDEQHFDFMSLDVEGHELGVLNGIDWNKTTIDVIITENRSKPVFDLLSSLSYEHYLRIHKDAIWVRKGSGIVFDPSGLSMMKSFNRTSMQFPANVVDPDPET